MLRTRYVRQDLRREAALWGSLLAYRHLKSVWLAHSRAADAARQSHEQHPEVLSDGDLTLLETAMVHYAEYLNSTGIYTVDPFNLEDIEILRTSSILRFAAARQTQPQAANPPTTSKPTPTTRRIDPYIDVAFGSSQTSPTPRPYRNHRRGPSQSS
ncbi:Hypothetical protein PENO1_031120 [Penicillium occitanis (nom. inval.)]|nr:Hypothetical protein PENO1_031120 [Penicillium occitanis (nom. inval.)]PCH04237.1 hypothetical protein PENOC_034390 [Penicillium occitanis (nom. inval.)]